MDIRFANLGNEGVFNVTSETRDNCVILPLLTWTHVVISCNKQTINVYVNGTLQTSIPTQRNINIGNLDQLITLGKSSTLNSYNNPAGILIAKMRWYADILQIQIIAVIANEHRNK